MLAQFYANLGTTLHLLGNYKDACTARLQACVVMARTTPENLTEHNTRLAGFYNALGDSFDAAEHVEGAADARKHGVALQRQLFELNPNAHRAQLAEYLHKYGCTLFNCPPEKFIEDACCASREAVALLRGATKLTPASVRVS